MTDGKNSESRLEPPHPAVRLTGIRKRFGEVIAVRGVDLDVEQGEFLTLLGPSGCGKTTTLRIIGGLETPDAGRVEIHGAEVTQVPPYLRPVNTVFQSYALFPHLSAFENVAFGLRMQKVDRHEIQRRVAEQLDMVGLTSAAKRKPHQLSGGEQQRVALARALVLRPYVLLLDEPLGSLDYKLRLRMEMEMRSLQRQAGISFVYVTHDQTEALAMSDRIGVMNGGLIEQIGSPIEVYERPSSRFVAGFLGDSNFFEGRVVSRNGAAATVEVDRVGRFTGVAVNGTVGLANKVVIAIRPEHITCAGKETTGDSNANRISGSIEEIIIGGALDRKVMVRLPGGDLLEALVRARDAGDMHPGDAVVVSWPEHWTNLIAADA